MNIYNQNLLIQFLTVASRLYKSNLNNISSEAMDASRDKNSTRKVYKVFQ